MKHILLGLSIATSLLGACGGTADPVVPDPSLVLSMFDMSSGDKVTLESTTSSFPGAVTTTTVIVTSVTGASGEQTLLRGDENYRMRNGLLERYRSIERPMVIAKFPCMRADTIDHDVDTLKNASGKILQVYDRIVIAVVADTTVTTRAGSFRCGVFRTLSVPTLFDGVGMVVTQSLIYVSPRVGVVSEETYQWAGTSTDGPPFGASTSTLVDISRK